VLRAQPILLHTAVRVPIFAALVRSTPGVALSALTLGFERQASGRVAGPRMLSRCGWLAWSSKGRWRAITVHPFYRGAWLSHPRLATCRGCWVISNSRGLHWRSVP